MASEKEDVLSKVKGDPVLAERLRCGGCQRALNQVEDYTLVEIPGKKRSPESETGAAKGFLCSQCQKDAARSKEGPRQAVYIDTFGDVRIDFYDNLVDSSSSGGGGGGSTTQTTAATTTQPAEEKAAKTKAVK